MSGMLADVVGFLGRSFDAWMDDLGGFVPGSRVSSRSQRAADATVGVTPSGALFLIEPAKRAQKAPPSSEGSAEDNLVNYLGWLARTKPIAVVRLRLPLGSYFERKLDIPEAAARQVRSILALNLERSTPFKMAEVYSAYKLEPHPDRSKGLLARQFIAKRKLADGAIANIEALGLRVSNIDCVDGSGAPLPVDFLDLTETEKPRSRRWLMGLIALVALAGSALWIAQSRRESVLATLEQSVASARQKAETARLSNDKAAAIDKTIEAIKSVTDGQMPVVVTLNELTRLLPDDVSLETLKLDGDTLEISGNAASAAALVTLVERSAVFKDASLTAPVVPDGASGKERVSLRLKLRQSGIQAIENKPKEPLGGSP